MVTATLRSSDHPAVVQLGASRSAVWATHQYRMNVAHDRALYNEAVETWEEVSADYQLTVAAALADQPRDLFMAAQAELGQRLAAGLKVLTETPEVAALFSRLLWRYEATCDVLTGIKSVADWLRRLDHRANLELQWRTGYGKQTTD